MWGDGAWSSLAICGRGGSGQRSAKSRQPFSTWSMKLHLHPKLARYFVLALGNANLIVAGFGEIGIKDYAPGTPVVFARWRLHLAGSNELTSDRPDVNTHVLPCTGI